MDNEAWFDKDWLTVQNYQFKILTMVAVLAENHFAYRGKLKDMCEFLGVAYHSKNNAKIKDAITALELSGDIKVIKDGTTYTLSLSAKAEKKQRIIKLRKNWVKLIQGYQSLEKNRAVAWENILKILIYLIADNSEVKTYKSIAKELSLTEDVVKNSIYALDVLEFDDMEVKRKLKWYKKGEEFKIKGQEITVGLVFK